MINSKNKYSNKQRLSRYIPDNIKLEIRRRSKFGCVMCRCAIYEYEHIIPEFHDATEHNPEHMCLLCGRCHNKVTKGLLSKSTIQKKYKEIQNATDVKKPFDDLDLSHNNITVKLGSCIFKYSKCLILVNDIVVLAIEPPEDNSSFPVLSGFFADDNGNELFRINKNEWQGSNDVFDIEIVSNNIKIRTLKQKTALHLIVHPPESIEIVELDMRIGQSHLILTKDELKVGRITPNAEYYIGIGRLECLGADVGVSVDSINTPHPCYTGLTIIGGEGIDLKGTGIKLGVGSGSMCIKELCIEDANKERTIVSKYPLTYSLEGEITIHPPRIS
jgi:uncharacterized membrane protein